MRITHIPARCAARSTVLVSFLALCLCLSLRHVQANSMSCVSDAAEDTTFCSDTFGPNEGAEEALEEEEEEEGSSTSVGCFCDIYSTVFGDFCEDYSVVCNRCFQRCFEDIQSDECSCLSSCEEEDTCCIDYESVCTDISCYKFCGLTHPSGTCSCKESCENSMDLSCCSDFNDQCVDVSDEDLADSAEELVEETEEDLEERSGGIVPITRLYLSSLSLLFTIAAWALQ